MALKMKENFQKNASQTTRQGTAANVYINRAGRSVPLNPTPASSTPASSTPKETSLSKDAEDITSIKGKQSGRKCFVLFVDWFFLRRFIWFDLQENLLGLELVRIKYLILHAPSTVKK